MAVFTVVVLLLLVEAGARALWAGLEAWTFSRRLEAGEKVLRNDGIHFMKQSDGLYGYVLKPGFDQGSHFTNAQGFAQRDTIPIERRPGVLRLVAMGESTTHGHGVDTGNYPAHLRRLLKGRVEEAAGVEVINAGVSGWISDQVALRAEHQLAAYRPDVVLLYVGWNDFQSYDPLGPVAKESNFERTYGTEAFRAVSGLRSVALVDAAIGALRREVGGWGNRRGTAERGRDAADDVSTYRFFLHNLDRVVEAYRAQHPEVVIAISTLVARWPYGGREWFESTAGRPWWMARHELSPDEAAERLSRFNRVIRAYVRRRGDVLLLDPEPVFARLDRGRLFWDFAHLHDEGYELLAEVFYASLRQAEVVHGRTSSRLGQLLAEYDTPPAFVGAGPPAE